MRFCSGSGAIVFRISALWPGGQTFLSEEHLKKFANAYSVSENVSKHDILLAEDLHRKESQLPTLLEILISFIAPYKGALDCLYKLLLIAVTLPVTSASWERIFSKMKLVTLPGGKAGMKVNEMNNIYDSLFTGVGSASEYTSSLDD